MYKIKARLTYSNSTCKSAWFNWGRKYKTIRRAMQAYEAHKENLKGSKWELRIFHYYEGEQWETLFEPVWNKSPITGNYLSRDYTLLESFIKKAKEIFIKNRF